MFFGNMKYWNYDSFIKKKQKSRKVKRVLQLVGVHSFSAEVYSFQPVGVHIHKV